MKTIFKLNKIWTGFMTAGFLSTVCYSNVLHNVLYHEVIEYIELFKYVFVYGEKKSFFSMEHHKGFMCR